MGLSHSPQIVTNGMVLCLDAGNYAKSYPVRNFTSAKIYSVYNGGLRSANYTIQYSDDNSNWTTAFSGVASNNTSCGIQNNTGSGDGSYGFHRYWRYVEGSAIAGHHPRVSRIILTDINGIDSNLVVYTSDNCSDTGTYIVGTVSSDFGGTTWTDLSGLGNTGTLTNGPTYSSANGGSLVFDGTNDYASITYSSSLDFPTALTISVWFYSGTNSDQTLYLKGRTDSDNYNPYISNSGYYAWTGSNGRARYLPPANYIQNNTWYNLTVSHTSGSTPNVYKNGVLSTTHTFAEGNGTYALGTNLNPVSINADVPRGTIGSFNGRISTIQAYNKALSAAEVSQNFQALRGRFGI